MMKMTAKQLLVFVLLMVSVTGYSQKYALAKWEKEEYRQGEEIPTLAYSYNKEGKLFYLVTNDNDNLYIHLKVIDEVPQKKILYRGFTLWVDASAKNKKDKGITFPLKKSERADPKIWRDNSLPQKKDDFNTTKGQLLNQRFEIQLNGFDDKKSEERIPAINDNDINGKMIFSENGDLHYLLIIPFKRIGLSHDDNTLMSINMESGSDEKGGSSTGSKGTRGVNSGKMNGGMRSGMRGGGRGSMGGRHGGSRNQGMMKPDMQRQGWNSPIKISVKKVKLTDKVD